MKRLILSTALAVLAGWLLRLPCTPCALACLPTATGKNPPPPIPCHISLPAASCVFLSSLTSDTSLLFICLFSLSPHSGVGLFFFKSCPPPWSKWFLPQSFSLRAVGEAERPSHGSELRPKSPTHNLQLNCTKLPILPVNWHLNKMVESSLDRSVPASHNSLLFFLSLIYLHIVPKLSALPCFLLFT